MKRRVLSTGFWVSMVLAGALQGCGGGGGDSTGTPSPFTLPTPTPTPTNTPVFSVLTAEEVAAVKDDPSTYTAEFDRVIDATVVTQDGTYTFADVNADTDDTDANEPEINAHLVIAGAGYEDDLRATNATLRLRGSSTRLADQKSYRVKLAKNMPLWRGEATLQLNKHPYDLARMRNKLAMDLFRDMPHVASLRTQFVHMTVTNKNAAGVPYATADFGLFTHVEKMGSEYLANHKLAPGSNVYKAEDFAFEPSPSLTNYASTQSAANKVAFEKVLSLEADNKDHSQLIAMVNAVNNESMAFEDTFDKYFDKANYLTWLASNVLMGNRDTINQNFGLYQPAGGSKFYFVPWDYDGAFGFENQPDQAAAGALYADWQKTIANWWGVPLHRRFLQDPKHLAELKLAVNEIYNAYLANDKIKTKVDRYKLLVRPYVEAAPDLTYLPLLSGSANTPLVQWTTEADRLAVAVKTNHDLFLASLDAPMSFWQSAEFLPATNQLRLAWDAAVDLQGQAVSYTVQLATTPGFAPGSLVSTPVTTTDTSLTLTRPADGIYYLKVTAKDSAGNTQNAFDRFDVGTAKYFGVSAYRVATDATTGVPTVTPL